MYNENHDLFSVTLIKQYHFCPRIIYFLEVLGVKERETESMINGHEKHESFHQLEKRRKTVLGKKEEKTIEKYSKIPIASKKLGLMGVVDQVVKTERGYAIIEYKTSKKPTKIPKGHIYQAAAYALLAEEKFNIIVKSLKIYYSQSKEIVEMPLTQDIRNHVKWTIRKIREIIEKEKLPEVKINRKCKSCGYKWICKEV